VKASGLTRRTIVGDRGIDMIVKDVVGPQDGFKFERYKNTPVTEWVNNGFRTELERSAAWAMFAHICNEYPACQTILRGELVEMEEY
jgi:hypothetical protein